MYYWVQSRMVIKQGDAKVGGFGYCVAWRTALRPPVFYVGVRALVFLFDMNFNELLKGKYRKSQQCVMNQTVL